MEGTVTFFQDIQDAYATLSELTMVIIDKDGNEITNVSNFNSISKIIYKLWASKEAYQDQLESFVGIENPVVVVNRIGLKLIVTPILVSGIPTYFLFSGFIAKAATKPYIKEYIHNHYQNLEELVEAIELSSELADEEVKEKLVLMKKCKSVLETYVAIEKERKDEQQKSTFILQSLESIQTGQATMPSFLEKLYETNPGVDFLGIATEGDSNEYVIDAIHGEDVNELKGKSFLIGEGFLGHTVATQQFQFWTDVQNNPRIGFFQRHGLTPKSLFCVPICQKGQVAGILFGGSTRQMIDDVQALESFKIHSSLLNLLVSSKEVNESLQNHLMELATFNEIFQVITTVKDMKRVLYILVDISLNILRGPFACVVYRPTATNSKIDIVSRGLSATEINDYCYNVAVKTFTETNQESTSKPVQTTTNWGTNVIEFPLRYDDHVYGILCVGLNPKTQTHQYQAFLSTLAAAGSISLHLCQAQSDKTVEKDIVQLLLDLQNTWSQVDQERSKRIIELVEGFSEFLLESIPTSALTVCGLLSYDFEFIKRYIKSQETLSILEGCHKVLQNEKVTNRTSEIMGLISYFVQQEENIQSLDHLLVIPIGLKEQFTLFIQQHSIVETELTIDITQKLSNQETQAVGSADVDLKTRLNLSSREIDVLNHILKGYNNRDIASILYISEHTVKNHITKILQKLDVQDRAQAIAMIYQMGYSPPSS